MLFKNRRRKLCFCGMFNLLISTKVYKIDQSGFGFFLFLYLFYNRCSSLSYVRVSVNQIDLVRIRDVQEPESEPESSKFFRSQIGLGVKFNVKTGVGVGAGVTISLSYYCNVH